MDGTAQAAVQSVGQVNITAAALTAQFSLLVIMAVATAIMRFGRSHHQSSSPLLILGLGLVTLGFLLFTQDVRSLWQPLLGETALPSIGSSAALLIMFCLDITCVMILVFFTDGSHGSPFSPLFFILPIIAIFLREPFSRLALYVATVSVFFTVALIVNTDDWNYAWQQRSSQVRTRVAFWWVSLASLLLTTLLAYATRPR